MPYIFLATASVQIQKVGQIIAQVPEPGMMLLFGLFAGGLGLFIGRKRA
jgi:hypothetical protein